MRSLPKPLVWAGMSLMLLVAFVHLISAPYAFEDATYKGGLLVIAAISALIAATGIQEGAPSWGWGLGSIVAVAALASYMVNITVGLPGLPAEEQGWQNPLALVALVAEAGLVMLAAGTFYIARRQVRRVSHRMAS
ncbi:MAG TPA: hypothetical protein VFO07_12495 [Roseiflexaceae bacterium]|nr:hypothetical protein [Roseiflexaceae bacterium]